MKYLLILLSLCLLSSCENNKQVHQLFTLNSAERILSIQRGCEFGFNAMKIVKDDVDEKILKIIEHRCLCDHYIGGFDVDDTEINSKYLSRVVCYDYSKVYLIMFLNINLRKIDIVSEIMCDYVINNSKNEGE